MREQMSIGELVDALNSRHRSSPVWVVAPDGQRYYPQEIGSYRGYYEQLAICYRERSGKHEKPLTVAELAHECALMQSAEITGYKGGTYTTNEGTPVWLSSYGDVTEFAVVDVRTSGDGAVEVISVATA